MRAAEVTVSSVMREDVVTLEPEASLLEAERIMRLARIRHLPITRDGLLVGVLSHRDVLEASLARLAEVSPGERIEHLRALRVEALLDGPARTVEPDLPIRDAALLMLRLKIGCLPVVEESAAGAKLLGLVTESDLLRRAYAPDFTGASD